jgi:hypothetical protein
LFFSLLDVLPKRSGADCYEKPKLEAYLPMRKRENGETECERNTLPSLQKRIYKTVDLQRHLFRFLCRKLKWLLNCQALSPRGSAHWKNLLIEYSSTNLLTNLLPTAESPEYYKHSCRLFPSQNRILTFLRSLSAWV